MNRVKRTRPSFIKYCSTFIMFVIYTLVKYLQTVDYTLMNIEHHHGRLNVYKCIIISNL